MSLLFGCGLRWLELVLDPVLDMISPELLAFSLLVVLNGIPSRHALFPGALCADCSQRATRPLSHAAETDGASH